MATEERDTASHGDLTEDGVHRRPDAFAGAQAGVTRRQAYRIRRPLARSIPRHSRGPARQGA